MITFPSVVRSRSDVRNVRSPRTHVSCHSSLVMFLMLLAPHPSWLIILIHHHLLTLRSYGWFVTHLLTSYTLVFLACTSLIVCLARDPGPISSPQDIQDDNEESSFTEALMAPIADDFNTPEKWCKKCWATKPERAHHCSICRRCVLKMGANLPYWYTRIFVLTSLGKVDHHCQWMANKCIVSYLTPPHIRSRSNLPPRGIAHTRPLCTS